MIFHRWSVLRRARANRSMTKCETQKNKIVETFCEAHTRLFGLWILLFSSISIAKSSRRGALRAVLFVIIQFSSSFNRSFCHSTIIFAGDTWLGFLCAAFVWISFEFHRARQQQIHPTIEMRMPCHTLCINIYKVKPHIWNLNSSATQRYRMNWNLKFQLHHTKLSNATTAFLSQIEKNYQITWRFGFLPSALCFDTCYAALRGASNGEVINVGEISFWLAQTHKRER